MISADVFHNIVEAATCFHHGTEEQAHTYNHCDCTEGVGDGNAFEIETLRQFLCNGNVAFSIQLTAVDIRIVRFNTKYVLRVFFVCDTVIGLRDKRFLPEKVLPVHLCLV